MDRPLSERINYLRGRYQEEIQPFVDVKIHWYNITIPTVVITPNGGIETKHNYPPGVEELLWQIDEHIKRIGEKYQKEVNKAFSLYVYPKETQQ